MTVSTVEGVEALRRGINTLMIASILGLSGWLLVTANNNGSLVARIDERTSAIVSIQDQVRDLTTRVARLEGAQDGS